MAADQTHYGPNTTLGVQQLFIGGRYRPGTAEISFENLNPATNHVICEVEMASAEDVEAAVEAAQEAFLIWSATPARERAKVLLRAAAILRERNRELARLETLDTGKPIAETAEVDVITGAEMLEYYAGLAPAIHGEHHDFGPDAFAMVRREPLGVCAGIGAWNYPIQIALWKSAPALACGNTMIFKPAELTPVSALKLAEIYLEAGLPPGAFNVVQGDGRVGQLLSRHPGIAKISLTGEVGTGRKVMADAAQTLKGVTLELGGKSPLIVFDDADFDGAVDAAMSANFYSAGEVCSNGTRVFVQRRIYRRFLESLEDKVARIPLGDPFDPATRIGALISAGHLEKVMGHIEAARRSNALHVVGGHRPEDPALAAGNFVHPAVFAECTDDMSFVRDEIFGPVMAVLPFEEEHEVVARANHTPFGLAGAVFTTDFARAHRVANALQAGTVWINDYNVTPPEVPFGGHKQSGVGRENGLETIGHFTQTKTIYANLGRVAPYF
ncbi:betaine-aldehyde dehydrogenase [Minwuia thermotolerans]|uniref:Betaine-aldehyde dehydrogenase n=1 Tax=Minwuia thermotolerans TaxID=2056226 RepID=A0A2M9G1E0_9PROT|nr:betaine-aldehyde dehydrogenase [Minwuia thermotolerans]PJK29525.1 betaine-aldehyde dehydrogenase [Minwuia thermotolerans]